MDSQIYASFVLTTTLFIASSLESVKVSSYPCLVFIFLSFVLLGTFSRLIGRAIHGLCYYGLELGAHKNNRNNSNFEEKCCSIRIYIDGENYATDFPIMATRQSFGEKKSYLTNFQEIDPPKICRFHT